MFFLTTSIHLCKDKIIDFFLFEDITVGRINKKNFPSNYAREHFNLSVERLRRCLNLHPEFSARLSDIDRSLLWKCNHTIAAALVACKVNNYILKQRKVYKCKKYDKKSI